MPPTRGRPKRLLLHTKGKFEEVVYKTLLVSLKYNSVYIDWDQLFTDFLKGKYQELEKICSHHNSPQTFLGGLLVQLQTSEDSRKEEYTCMDCASSSNFICEVLAFSRLVYGHICI